MTITATLPCLDTVDPAAFATIDLATLAGETVALPAPAAFDAGHTIAFVEAETGTVSAVPSLIETLLRNLVDNAVRHTPQGTAVTVTAGPGPVVSVSDDGHGFSADSRAEPEGGAGRRSDGLGIGRRIVEIRAGTLKTTSLPGAGTAVTIRFPGRLARIDPRDRVHCVRAFLL